MKRIILGLVRSLRLLLLPVTLHYDRRQSSFFNVYYKSISRTHSVQCPQIVRLPTRIGSGPS